MGLKYAEVFEGPLPRAKVDYLTINDGGQS